MSDTNLAEINTFEDIFGFSNSDNNTFEFPWDTSESIFENPLQSTTTFDSLDGFDMFDESVGNDNDILNVIDTMTSPSVLNSKLDKEVGNTMYMDTLQLIQKVEVMLGNTKSPSEINKKEAIQFINSKLAMKTLNMAMEYKRLLGETQTYQFLLDGMKPFDGSMQKVILEKENEIKQLKVELDLYKLKTTQTEKQMVDLRNVYETRRKEDFNRVKSYLQEGIKIRNRKEHLEEENTKLNEKLENVKAKYQHAKKSLRYAMSEVLYQKKQKINARKKAYKLKTQLNESFTELVVIIKDVESIKKRVNALDKMYSGLAKHFQDFFRVDKICDCSICMDDINSTEKYHTCSNSTCGLIFHVDCLKNTAKQMQSEMTECQFCKVEDPVYPTILDDFGEELDDMEYESDGDEDFIPGVQGEHITQRDINRFQSNMFLSPEELEARLEEEEEDHELDPDYNPDSNEEDDDDEDDDDEDDEEDEDDEDDDDNDQPTSRRRSNNDDDDDIFDINVRFVLTE
jgi:hypothetical protein